MTALANARRACQILGLFLNFALASLLAAHGRRLLRMPLAARLFPTSRLPPPDRLRQLFEALGGTFVKFGQVLSLQPDVLSPAYCTALFDLLDRVEPLPYREVRRVVTEELGRPPEEVFEDFDPVPLATASVGQVHVARLRAADGASGSGGTRGPRVAVKVQRPQAAVEFASDLRLMAAFMTAIRWLRLRPLYWMIEPLTEFVTWTWEEIDYRHEARYSERLRSLAKGNPIQKVPRVYGEYTTRRTLVVEYLDGVTLLAYLRARERGDEVLLQRLAAMRFDGRRFATNVIDNFLGDAFRHGIYHADLHPANLMILPDSVVGYIDFGITGVLSPYSRRHLMAMTLALAQGDMEMLDFEFLKLSAWGDEGDPAAFREGLRALASEWYEHDGNRRRLRVNFTRVMTDMLRLSRQTGVMPERDIVKYIRSAIAIDGLNLRFEPEFDVSRHLEQECRRFSQWQAVQSALSEETMLAWSSLGPRLAAAVPAQAGGFLDRLSRGGLTIGAELVGDGARREETRNRAIRLGVVVLTLAILLVFLGQPVSFGWNLFTTEVALVLAGLGLLLPTLRRLA